VNEDRSARYHKLGRRAAVVSTAWSAGLLLLLAATPASLWLRGVAERIAALSSPSWLFPSAVVLAYVALLALIHEIGAVPISFYRSYLLEHRYDLSTETIGGWVIDQLKGGALGAVLSFAGCSLLYLAMRTSPAETANTHRRRDGLARGRAKQPGKQQQESDGSEDDPSGGVCQHVPRLPEGSNRSSSRPA